MSVEHREPSFSSPDAVDAAEYPRVNRAAVVALLLGIVSGGALASPVLWFLPLQGIVVAIVALRSIARADEAVIGRRAAVIGLALSVVFITWAPCRYFVRHEVLYRQAREHAEFFLGLVLEGRLHEAHQLTLDKPERQPPNANLNQAYRSNERMAELFESLCETSPMSEIIAVGGKGSVRFVGRRDIEVEKLIASHRDIVLEEFAVDCDEGGQTQTIPVVIVIARRRHHDTGEAYWSIRGAKDPSAFED